MHCQECGEAAKPFVGGRCAACRGDVGEVVQGADTKAPRGKRQRGKAKKSSGLGEAKDISPEEQRTAPTEMGQDDGAQKGYTSLFGPQR